MVDTGGLSSTCKDSSLNFFLHSQQVSLIVEADPEVLGDNRVQMAVEGRFQDSNISAREAALEIVGRHIASHPDVGQKVLWLPMLVLHANWVCFRPLTARFFV